VEDTLPKSNKIGTKFLHSARDFAEEVIQQIRTVSYLLHPLLLDEAGLGAALRSFATGFAERSGISVKVKIKRGFGPLSQDMEIALFRVVQESLTNVHRHSKSRVAKITLEQVRGKVRVTIEDRGVGMPPASSATGWNPPMGVGIAGMRERVKQLGGIFDVRSEPGRGTAISVELPISRSSKTAHEKQNEGIRGTKAVHVSNPAANRG
jgi:signal transduction histidine kinase